jgi:site-specific recombinase XerD
MKKVLVKNCKYATSTFSGNSRYCDVFMLIGDDDVPLWHENLFLADMARQVSFNTLRNYANDLLSFSKMSIHVGGCTKVTQTTLTGYIHAELFQVRQYAISTISRHVETLKKFMNWLSQKGYIQHRGTFSFAYKHLFTRDTVNLVNTEEISETLLSQYISPTQFNELLSNVKCKNDFLKSRDRLILKFGYYTGTRAADIHELNALDMLSRLELAKKHNNDLFSAIKVPIVSKGNKRRFLFLPPQLCEDIFDFLTRYRNLTSEASIPLFSTLKYSPIKDTKHASSVFAKACKLSSSLKPLKSSGYHRLRKSFATNTVKRCYENGTNPMIVLPRVLGHNKPSTSIQYIIFEALKNNRSDVLNEFSMTDAKFNFLKNGN